jgi:hypothetical protein
VERLEHETGVIIWCERDDASFIFSEGAKKLFPSDNVSFMCVEWFRETEGYMQ